MVFNIVLDSKPDGQFFFDRLDIDYRYEYEGFQTQSGWYLPDFYLPEHGWFEIKPEEPSDVDLARIGSLCCENDERCYILIGFPLDKTYLAPSERYVEGNLWMENYRTGDIYFVPNVHWTRKNDDTHLEDFDYVHDIDLACTHCTKLYTCEMFGIHGNLMVYSIKFDFDCRSYLHKVADADPLLGSEFNEIFNKLNEVEHKLVEQHEVVKANCKYRRSQKIDAAYKFAKNFRFY